MIEIKSREIQNVKKHLREEEAGRISSKSFQNLGSSRKDAKIKNLAWIIPQSEGKKKLWREAEAEKKQGQDQGQGQDQEMSVS